VENAQIETKPGVAILLHNAPADRKEVCMDIRTVVAAAVFALVVPAAASAQRGDWAPPGSKRFVETPAYRAGLERGFRIGEDDARRNRPFDLAAKSDYRSGDAGYRREFGDRNRYRVEFRFGFETGYRRGFDRYRSGFEGRGGWRPGAGGPPPWAVARGRGGYQRTDYAFRLGFTDGYEAGLRRGRDRRQFDPIGEGRYRDGDRGYERNYGSRDFYRLRYREAFREGYQHGYEDGWRYDGRQSGRPWWWPW
jgi:hypothetical protein